MLVSKTTVNFAHRRGLDVTDWTISVDDVGVAIWHQDDENTPLVVYRPVDIQGGFQFVYAPGLDLNTQEELPAWVNSEQRLREVIVFLTQEVA